MNQSWGSLRTLALAGCVVSALAAPAVGQAAPSFTAVDSKGQQHRLADFKGKVVVLEWTNHECPYVQKHYKASNMQNLQKQARQMGAVWLSVISSAREF